MACLALPALIQANDPGEERLPEAFLDLWRARDRDIEILLVGDSLTGNTGGSGENPDAAHSPPGFNHLHWGYLLWDKICDNKPICDRFDSQRDGRPVFDTTGTWAHHSAGKFNEPGHAGEHSRGTDGTWMSSSPNAAVSFVFDADTHEKLNIVEGRHPDGARVRIRVAEGDGRLLASLDKRAWAEANGFAFSQQQVSEQSITITGIALHQRHRRVWMKVADETVSGPLHISFERDPADADPDAYLYFWGTERWSGNSVFVTNLGRGGRRIELLNRNITDIYDRHPNLVILQLPLNNEYRIATPRLEEAYRWYFFGQPDNPDSFRHTRSLAANSNGFTDFTCLAVLPTGRTQYWDGDTPQDHNGPNDLLPHVKFKRIFAFLSAENACPGLRFFNLHDRMIEEARGRNWTIEEALARGNFTTDGVHLSPLASRLYAEYLAALFP